MMSLAGRTWDHRLEETHSVHSTVWLLADMRSQHSRAPLCTLAALKLSSRAGFAWEGQEGLS